MKIVSFTGKSGTGKSYQATALAQRRGFDAIIDDGLLIYKGQIVAGTSAKKCASKAAAMRTALFNYEDHRNEVKSALVRYHPETLMIIGTSDRMTNIIAEQLGLHEPEERIYIEDVTTEEERAEAAHHRNDEGQHVIPAPVGQLRRDFAGYFMNPLKFFRDRALGNAVGKQEKDEEDGPEDRTVVRPQFSYFGTFTINEHVIRSNLGNYPEEQLEQACKALGAEIVSSNADFCAVFPFLPYYPVTLKIWFADEEMDASGRMFLNKNADHYLTVEDAVTVGDVILNSLAEQLVHK